MSADYFKYPELLTPPVRRAHYSDRTAWLMAVMSQLAYLKFEEDPTGLKEGLTQASFELVQVFNAGGTQAFLAKRSSDGMAVLAFRGTEKDDPKDVLTDIDIRFFRNENKIRSHQGFYSAYQAVSSDVKGAVDQLPNFALYVTGHSLGGALALMATRVLNSDNLAACYTFGSPKVGNEEFDDEIKPPIYRVVHAYDPVPFGPPTLLFDLLALLLPWRRASEFIKNFRGYEHHGDMRYLTPAIDPEESKVISNYNDFLRMWASWVNRKKAVKHHAIDIYCEKLGRWALKRWKVK